MSCCWITLSLLYVLLHRASADAGVRLMCNKTVTVQIGRSVTLNCSINWTPHDPRDKCVGTNFYWYHTEEDTNESIPCNDDRKKYTCEWDNRTYVSLTILSVQKEENYTVWMLSYCGMDAFPSITVQVTVNETMILPDTSNKETPSNVTAIVLGVVVTATVVAVLRFLFKWYRTKQKSSNTECGERAEPSSEVL